MIRVPLVTGASGLVGSKIIRNLLSIKKSVIAIKRKTGNLEWTSDINDFIEGGRNERSLFYFAVPEARQA